MDIHKYLYDVHATYTYTSLHIPILNPHLPPQTKHYLRFEHVGMGSGGFLKACLLSAH